MPACREDQFYVIGVKERRIGGNLKRLTFHTTRGDFDAIASIRRGMRQGVVMLGGRAGGFSGPGLLFAEMAGSLREQKIASIRINYRYAYSCADCAVDALLALQYLDDEGVHDAAFIGWSSGGAAALAAAAVAHAVRGVAAISTQSVPDCCIKRLSSKHVLLIHGDADIVSPMNVPRHILNRSKKTHRLIIYPGADHGMRDMHDKLREDLLNWVTKTLGNTTLHPAGKQLHTPPVWEK